MFPPPSWIECPWSSNKFKQEALRPERPPTCHFKPCRRDPAFGADAKSVLSVSKPLTSYDFVSGFFVSQLALSLRMSRSMSATTSLLRSTGKAAATPCINHARWLAIPSSSKSRFSQTLEDGPSLDEFISGNVQERVVLGNTSQ